MFILKILSVIFLLIIFYLYHNRSHPKIIETIIIFFSACIITLAPHFLPEKMEFRKIIEAFIIILSASVIAFTIYLVPEKMELQFPFVYFFDWESGKQIDLISPGHYFLENKFLQNYQKITRDL